MSLEAGKSVAFTWRENQWRSDGGKISGVHMAGKSVAFTWRENQWHFGKEASFFFCESKWQKMNHCSARGNNPLLHLVGVLALEELLDSAYGGGAQGIESFPQ